MDQYEVVRTGHRVYGQKISELARLTGHSRNTIKKAIRGEPWGYSERQHQPFPVIGEYIKQGVKSSFDVTCTLRTKTINFIHFFLGNEGKDPLLKRTPSTIPRPRDPASNPFTVQIHITPNIRAYRNLVTSLFCMSALTRTYPVLTVWKNMHNFIVSKMAVAK